MNTNNTLYDYQELQIQQLSELFASGKTSVLCQLDTGGGKTIEFATIAQRYIAKSPTKRIVIAVHRDFLLRQTDKALREWYGIEAQIITSDTKIILDRKVYICMVETLYRRLLSNEKYLPPIGLLILDECHLGNFRKLHKFFKQSLTIGFTATPIAADRRHPLNKDYQEIVVGPGIKRLIQIGVESNYSSGLMQNITYSIKGVDRSKLKVINGKFDDSYMANEYGKLRHVENTIDQYEKIAKGKKAIIYNVNKQHNNIVTEAFKRRGYPCLSVDDETQDEVRADIFYWFKHTEGAILCNVGVASMGFDEPTVECIIPNLSTMSVTKWLQMCGRGGRPCPSIGKTLFIIIDMGGNAYVHEDWNENRDWHHEFHNPKKKSDKLDAAPYKDCPQCLALIPLRAMVCPYCGFMFPPSQVDYDSKQIELTVVTRNIDVKKLVELNARFNPYYTLFQIQGKLVSQVKYKLGKHSVTDEIVEDTWKAFEPLAEEWCKEVGKDWKKNKGFCHKTLNEKFEQMGWIKGSLKPMKQIETSPEMDINNWI